MYILLGTISIILLIVPISLLFFLYRFKFDSKLKRRIYIFCSTLLSIPCFYVGVVLIVVLSHSFYFQYTFDKKGWLENENSRYKFSNDIISRKILIGKSKTEIVNILGNPDNTTRDDHWYYNLGTRPTLFNIDPDTLEIEFKNGKVNKVIQLSH